GGGCVARAADAVVGAGRCVWASFFLGLFVGIIALVFGLAIMASVVGIPLGFAVFGTLAVLVPLGYVASALIFGRLMVHRGGTGGRLGAFFAGFGILRFGALVPGLGFVIGFFFATYGFGALLIAAGRAGPGAFRPAGLQPEYASGPPARYAEATRPPYVPIPEPRRRRAPATKRTTRSSAAARKSSARKRSTTRAKTAPRKPAKRTAKKTTKRTAKKATKRTAKKPAKKTTKRTAKKATKKTTKRRTTKRRVTTSRTNGRGSNRNRVSASNSRATKRPRPRTASTNRSRARARA